MQIDPYRRNLQRAYLDVMGDKVNGAPRTSRGRWRAASCGRSTPACAPRLPRPPIAPRGCIWRTCGIRSRRILDPKFAPAAAPQQGPLIIFGLDEPVGCWFDYAIRIEP